MTDRERITAYIDSLDPGHGELCDEIAREAREQGVPVVRRETASFLETLVAAFQPLQILEIGTAVGYSALLMAQVMPARGHITTIENYEPRIRKARENLARAGQEERITLLEGDATRHLEGLSGPYDLIFVDGAKDSISTGCPGFWSFWRREDFWSRTMCSRTEISLHPALRWNVVTGRSMPGCGSTCIP